MAIIQNGANGGFTGKAGSVSGYYSNGKWIIRGLRKLSPKNKIGTEKQQASRNRFTKMQKFLGPITPYIRIGFNMEGKKRMMTAHNVAKSYNMLNAQEPDGTIDYSKTCVTYGNLLAAEGVQVKVIENGLIFSWDNNMGLKGERAYDNVMILAYDVNDDGLFAEKGGAKRSACSETLVIEDLGKDQSYHTWISFISNDRQEISMSTYCGVYNFQTSKESPS